MSVPKPHRRMSLTQPTLPQANSSSATDVIDGSTNDAPVITEVVGSESNSVVRVMAYLAPDEAQTLEDLWMRARRLPTRPSKSDILRAALLLAAENEANLTNTLSRQQTNTLSRQRARKSRD